MNRLWIGVAVLVLFLGLGLGSMLLLERFQETMTEALEASADAVLAGDPDTGMEKARQARAFWEKYRKGLAAVSSHEPMEDMEDLFARLAVYQQTGDWTAYAVCCVRLAELSEAIAEAQGCSWWSLL